MAPTRRGTEGLLARVNFPLYTVQMLTSHHIIVGGGGGSSKTGVANGFEIFELMFDGKRFVAEEMIRHETGPNVVMNCACATTTATTSNSSRRMYVVAGQESHCQLYNVNVDIEDDDVISSNAEEDESSGNLRQRRRTMSRSSENGNSKSDDVDNSRSSQHQQQQQPGRRRRLRFQLKANKSIMTDYSVRSEMKERLQRVVRISRDGAWMATGGTDGVVRLWQFPTLKPLIALQGHFKEIDDLDISPDRSQLVSISKDGQGLIWCCETGQKQQTLTWSTPSGSKYLYKRCRYGVVEEERRGARSRLFTLANPVARTGKQLCYVQQWDAQSGELKRASLIEECLSALAVRDDGRFVAVGTMFSGSVFLYIAFSLQRVMTVNNAHSMFVTGLEFLPVLCDDSQPTITTLSEAAVISISVDNRICIHSLPFRKTLPPWLVMILICFTLFVTFAFCSYVGL